jgi:pyruvate/2-oxoglutarate/acetoin dehydrogenase E1 component
MHEISYAKALNEAIAEEMRRDPRVYMIGTEVGRFDYHLNPITMGLAVEFGDDRVIECGITERYIAGSVVGGALGGARPIGNLSSAAYATLAYDEIFAKGGMWHYEHGGNGGMTLPVVWLMNVSGYGSSAAEHVRAPIGMFFHSVGIKLVVPSNGYDAKGLLKAAIRDDNPVVFMNPRPLISDIAAIPDEDYTVPFGVAKVVSPGTDCTVVAVGFQVKQSLQAGKLLEKEGISIEVIDPRTLIPLDIDAIVASVRKTGRLVIVGEDIVRGSVESEIAFQVQEQVWESLKAPIGRIANPNMPLPASPVLHAEIMPSPDKIAAVVRATVSKQARKKGA